MATRTTREITLPPEIVALVLSFKPAVYGHEGERVRCGYSICEETRWDGSKMRTTNGGWAYYDCCGEAVSDRGSDYCRIHEGQYHPGTLDSGSYRYSGNPLETRGGYVRWTCCGAQFGQRYMSYASFSGTSVRFAESPPGCTRLDLTLRITTVTRPSQTDPEQNA